MEKIHTIMTLPELAELIHCDFHVDEEMRVCMLREYKEKTAIIEKEK